jgi:hypothetical protein
MDREAQLRSHTGERKRKRRKRRKKWWIFIALLL